MSPSPYRWHSRQPLLLKRAFLELSASREHPINVSKIDIKVILYINYSTREYNVDQFN